ncbi:hypothetical protein [Yokenella regensburgei]|uniref:hypothetical protein n=1 Tax=Yokenella regensburgei TaxID=158877 RepID=UPI003EDA4C0D
MNTQNVNVRTAAPESSRKMGEDTATDLSAIRELICNYSDDLKKGVQVTTSEVSRYGDVQVEIRTNGLLNWRAWSF